MAELVRFDDFVGPFERRAAEALEKGLPDDWLVVCNKHLVQGTRTRELDFVCVGRRTIFVLEEKGWSGEIRGTENGWLVQGELRSSPINQAEASWKMLSGLLASKLKDRLRGKSLYVEGMVILSSPSARFHISDPRAASKVLRLDDAAERLRQLDETCGRESIRPLRDEIRRLLTQLPPRPDVPRNIGVYEVQERESETPGCRTYRATHPDGTARLLRVYYAAATDDDPARDPYARRAYDAQRRLASEDLCPGVDPFFPWDDGRAVVFPFHPPKGISIARQSVDGPATDRIVPTLRKAFEALKRVHALKIVHRSLAPERVWIERDSERVRFSDFAVARMTGDVTVVARAEEFDFDHAYRAPECRIDLSQACEASDVYSLAATLIHWIAGSVPPSDDAWTPSPLRDARKDLDPEDADAIERALYPALQLDADRRPSIEDILSSLPYSIAGATDRDDDRSDGLSDERYRVLRQLGRGGTAETFLAKDLARDELVVLKRLLRPELHAYLATAEFRALNRLSHPCLPRLIDIYPAGDRFHLKLEYVEGESLRDAWRRLQSATLEERLALARRIANDVLDALGELHANGYVHRDVSPGNVLLPEGADERVRLIDFGLAARAADATSQVGTPIYSAPETESPHPAWSVSCDLYSLSVLLFELVAKRLPYRLDGLRRLKREALDLEGEERSEPAGPFLESLLRRGCCPAPHERFISADEMRRILRETPRTWEVDRGDRSASASGEIASVAAPIAADVSSPSAIEAELPRVPQINPFVAELRQAFRNSQLGNANNRGMDSEFSRGTYAPTELDSLARDVMEGRWRCVLLCGNPGDGKTAYLERIRDGLVTQGATVERTDASGWQLKLGARTFVAVYDASESHEGVSSEDLLASAFAPFKGAREPQAEYTALVAINDGRLNDFITKKRLTFRWLSDSLRDQLRKRVADAHGILVLDLKDRSPFSASAGGPSLFTGLLDAFVATDRWEICSTCSAEGYCPVRENAAFLHSPVPKERLETLLSSVYLLSERRPTVRDLRSALAWGITGDLSCERVHAEGPASATSDRRYYNLLFSSTGGEDLVLEAFRELDPQHSVHPQIDRRLTGHGSLPIRYAAARSRPLLPDGQRSPQTRLADEKRRYYFEAEAVDEDWPEPERLLPARYVAHFRDAVTGRLDLSALRSELIAGINRFDRIPPHAVTSGLALRLDLANDDLTVLRRWRPEEFEVVLPERPQTPLNFVPDHVVLRHVQGWPELRVDASLFELAMRASEGYVPEAAEQQSLVTEFERFKAELLTRPTHEALLITRAGDRRRATVENGKIVCRAEELL